MLVAFTLLLCAQVAVAGPDSPQLIYRLHCEGCHKPDGSGQPGFIPGFGQIGAFSSLPQGREFLIRVPGVSQSELSGEEIVRLMNWLIETYGHTDGYAGFEPYTLDEVELWRGQPISDAGSHRARLVASLNGTGSPSFSAATSTEVKAPAEPATPPTAFALCSACHATSTSGAHGMGPNLRGVFGRGAGSADGFAYTRSMRESGLVWDADRLDAFLQSPMSVIPNTSMVYGGEADPGKRAQIIEYLRALR